MDEEKKLTYGEKLVWLSFNPSEIPLVDEIKKMYASVIDRMNELREHTWEQETKRLCSIAITQAQDAQMWAVKAITYRE
jgi:hypothetical protein